MTNGEPVEIGDAAGSYGPRLGSLYWPSGRKGFNLEGGSPRPLWVGINRADPGAVVNRASTVPASALADRPKENGSGASGLFRRLFSVVAELPSRLSRYRNG